MGTFRFERHGRIQEWVAEELGFFSKLGLQYEIAKDRSAARSALPARFDKFTVPDLAGMESAYRDFVLSSTQTNVASTSHWAVSAAVHSGYGRLWPHAYAIMPAGLYAKPGIVINEPAELADVEIVVGRHSGSHFSAIHALEGVIDPAAIKFRFVAGRTKRLRYLLDGNAPAGNIYGVESYILEQHGFRKVMDTSFMVSFMIVGDPASEDVTKYFDALQSAQTSIDEVPQHYRHYLTRELPEADRHLLDVHRSGIGERMIFSPYPEDLLGRTFDWVTKQEILPRSWIE